MKIDEAKFVELLKVEINDIQENASSSKYNEGVVEGLKTSVVLLNQCTNKKIEIEIKTKNKKCPPHEFTWFFNSKWGVCRICGHKANCSLVD